MSDTTIYANSVFEQPWWLEIVAPGKWGEAIIREGEETLARLPFVLDGGRICMPPFTQTLGPWFKPELRAFTAGNAQLSRQKELVSALLEQLPAHRRFNQTFDSANDYILPYRWLGYRYTPLFSYRLGGLEDLDSIYAAFHKTAKKNIKYARNKTKIIHEKDPRNILSLYEKTFLNQNRPLPVSEGLLEKVVRLPIERGNGEIITAIDSSGHAHSSAFLLFDEKVCYYLIGGSDPAFRSSGAQSLVLWEAIQFASGRSKAFDFEGSNIEGIENFFRQFGGQRVINYSVAKQSLWADCLEMAKPRIKRMVGYKN